MNTKSPRVFLTAGWRQLAMINFEIDPQLLSGRTPPGTELDFFGGRTFVSLVGFRFENTKVFGMAIPFHRRFDEVNLRFYVRRKAAQGWRRGVVFIREIVHRPMVTLIARLCYGENYITLPMRHELRGFDDEQANTCAAEYGWKFRGSWNQIRVTSGKSLRLPAPGSEEEFIAEHYWGYSNQNNGTTKEYQVEHSPWRIWPGEKVHSEVNAAALYGEEFAAPLAEAPSSFFIAEGSPVKVYQGSRLAQAVPDNEKARLAESLP